MSKRAEIRERRRREKRRRQLSIISIVVGAVLVVVAIVILPDLLDRRPKGRPLADASAMGEPNAPVVIEDYSDFQCPFCRIFHEETLDLIVDEYVSTGEVYFVFRNYAFIGAESTAAANASLCAAEQNRFWEYADIAFANQTGENVGAFSDLRLLGFAAELGLNQDEFSACFNESRYQDQIDSDIRDGGLAGVASTPSFTINGKLFVGALPIEDFQVAIEEALVEAGASSP
jgi:protein-disulfide isomerase